MMTFTYPDARYFTRVLRVTIIVCALITLLIMQAAVLKHAYEHFASSHNRLSARVVQVELQTELNRSTYANTSQANTSQNDLPQGVTCQKCLEDVAHTFVLPSIVQISHADLAYEKVRAALPHNLPFLSPERANQRAPPSIA